MIKAPVPPPPHFEIGQTYACASLQPDRKLQVLVGHIDTLAGKHIVSVAISDTAPASIIPDIGHAPFGEEALARSCTRLTGAALKIPSSFLEGYETWRRDTGGGSYFTITVDQAVDHVIGLTGPAPR